MTHSSLEAAYDEHYVGILRLCVLLSGKEEMAEDLAQEVFIRAGSKLDKLGPGEIRPYLRRSAINLWKNRLRRLAIERRARVVQREGPSTSESPVEERDALWSVVLHLSPRQRACLVLRYYEDLSERQTAAVLGCSVGSVKRQTSRALARLRGELGK
jgi:RNA polymerase sigma factor (sigma-70 family)